MVQGKSYIEYDVGKVILFVGVRSACSAGILCSPFTELLQGETIRAKSSVGKSPLQLNACLRFERASW